MIHVGRRIGWIGIVIHESQSYSTHICMVFDQNRPNVVNMIRYIMRGWYEVCFCVYIYYTNIFLILCTYTLCDFSLEQQIVTLILGRLPSLIRTPFAVSSSNSTAFAKFPGSSRIFQQFQHGFRTKKAGPFFGGAKKKCQTFWLGQTFGLQWPRSFGEFNSMGLETWVMWCFLCQSQPSHSPEGIFPLKFKPVF